MAASLSLSLFWVECWTDRAESASFISRTLHAKSVSRLFQWRDIIVAIWAAYCLSILFLWFIISRYSEKKRWKHGQEVACVSQFQLLLCINLSCNFLATVEFSNVLQWYNSTRHYVHFLVYCFRQSKISRKRKPSIRKASPLYLKPYKMNWNLLKLKLKMRAGMSHHLIR